MSKRHACYWDGGKCTESEEGFFWLEIFPIHHKVNFCPCCGKEAPKKVHTMKKAFSKSLYGEHEH